LLPKTPKPQYVLILINLSNINKNVDKSRLALC